MQHPDVGVEAAAAHRRAVLCPGAGIRGALDTSFTRVPADADGKAPTGYGFWCNAWPENPAWKFVAVGLGNDVPFWTEFLRALAEIDPDMAVHVEHRGRRLLPDRRTLPGGQGPAQRRVRDLTPYPVPRTPYPRGPVPARRVGGDVVRRAVV
ncbi:hypothetical protein [Streptomyces sp. NBC_01235]|uniref:hypothetical protein n=1 Tax=Streptomyces sp. NBC_01235 TaxID=2903788 RepID=UPI002E16798E|nr:hypothetical protein OG289_07475 [Streptomyces sp. NBC_01235]